MRLQRSEEFSHLTNEDYSKSINTITFVSCRSTMIADKRQRTNLVGVEALFLQRSKATAQASPHLADAGIDELLPLMFRQVSLDGRQH